SLQAVVRHVRKISGSDERSGRSDAELLGRFIQLRDNAAMTALIERHGPMVHDLCRRLLHRETDADDAFQATFLVLLRKAHSIRKRRSLGSWLYGVAYRIARKTSANSHRQVQPARHTINRPADDPSTQAAWRELWKVLDGELNKLSEGYRAVLVL